jgi:hypothetical protein
VRAIFGRATGAFLLCPWHIFFRCSLSFGWTVSVYDRGDGFIS